MRLRNIMRGLLTLTLFTFTIQLTSIYGQSYRGLIISTPVDQGLTFEFAGDPGDTFSGSFTATHDFQNENAVAQYYTLASDIEIDPETGGLTYPTDLISDSKLSLASWINFGKEEIRLDKRGQKTNIPFTVSIPEDASPGSHYGVLLLSNLTREEFIEQQLDDEIDITGSGIGSRLGVNIIVNVSGEQNITTNIDEFYFTDVSGNTPWFNIFEYPPVNTVANINNSENTFIRPAGNVFIYKNDITKPVATFRFNENAERILPESKKQFTNTWNDSALTHILIDEGGEKRKSLVVDWSNIFAKFRFGKYNAVVKMTYDDIDGSYQVVEKTGSFWVIPWKVILAILIISTGIIVTYKIINNQQKKHKK